MNYDDLLRELKMESVSFPDISTEDLVDIIHALENHFDVKRLVEYKASGVSELTEWQKGWNDAIDTIMEETLTVDIIPVKHGHWINKGYYAICSECGANSGTQYNGLESIPRWSRYCPDCGAKMYEVEE